MGTRSTPESRRARDEFHKMLVQNHPKTFGGIDKWHHRLVPLKVGIHKDLIAAYPDIPWKTIRHFLNWYMWTPQYLKLTKIEGAPRIDLDGNTAGVVTPEQAKWSEQMLERYRDRWTARSQNAENGVWSHRRLGPTD